MKYFQIVTHQLLCLFDVFCSALQPCWGMAFVLSWSDLLFLIHVRCSFANVSGTSLMDHIVVFVLSYFSRIGYVILAVWSNSY